MSAFIDFDAYDKARAYRDSAAATLADLVDLADAMGTVPGAAGREPLRRFREAKAAMNAALHGVTPDTCPDYAGVRDDARPAWDDLTDAERERERRNLEHSEYQNEIAKEAA